MIIFIYLCILFQFLKNKNGGGKKNKNKNTEDMNTNNRIKKILISYWYLSLTNKVIFFRNNLETVSINLFQRNKQTTLNSQQKN